jgi:UDP-N-acetylglucosamine 2-epimerase (non-hydrolysing)
MKRFLFVVGARPNFMKVSPILPAMKGRRLESILVHTGQHYDKSMSDYFLSDLGIGEPDINLGVGSGSHTEQIGRIMIGLEKILESQRPDVTIVVGDVNSTLAGALTSVKVGIPSAHVEAGYRSFDWTMPEEINRRVVDNVSQLLFAPTNYAVSNLLAEGIGKERIHFVGNIMINCLINQMRQIDSSTYPEEHNLVKREYVVMTAHRPSNVDSPEELRNLIKIIKVVQDKIKVIYPIHPRTKKSLLNTGLMASLERMKNLIMTPPMGYHDFVRLMKDALFVMTDSGGIQEETTYLKVPCMTLRYNTERVLTLQEGTNTLVGLEVSRVRDYVKKITSDDEFYGAITDIKTPKFWDDKVGTRIVDILEKSDLSLPTKDMLYAYSKTFKKGD